MERSGGETRTIPERRERRASVQLVFDRDQVHIVRTVSVYCGHKSNKKKKKTKNKNVKKKWQRSGEERFVRLR